MNVEKTEVMKISRQSSSVQVMRNQKQPENVEYYNYFGSMMTSNAIYIYIYKCEIKPYIALATAAFKTKQIVFTSN